MSRDVSVREGEGGEVSLGRRGRSSYGEGGRGIRSCCPATSQILELPGIGFCMSRFKAKKLKNDVFPV